MMRERGFALAMVLWVLAGLTVVAATVAGHAFDSARSVKLLRDRVAAERAFLSTQARVGLLLSTGKPGSHFYLSPRGRLFADGRRLQVEDQEWVEVQDLRGLINLNRSADARLRALLRYCGAKEDQAESLKDSLLDYGDVDDLKRIHGAEAFEYRSAGLTPPRNAPLLSVDEVWRVKDFAALREAWQAQGCSRWTGVHGDGVMNRNSAPAEVLQMDGMEAGAAQAYVSARIDGLPDRMPQARGPDASNPFAWDGSGYVGQAVRVTHQMQNVEWCLSYVMEVSASRTAPPWILREPRVSSCSAVVPGTVSALPPAEHQETELEPQGQNAAPRLPFNLR